MKFKSLLLAATLFAGMVPAHIQALFNTDAPPIFLAKERSETVPRLFTLGAAGAGSLSLAAIAGRALQKWYDNHRIDWLQKMLRQSDITSEKRASYQQELDERLCEKNDRHEAWGNSQRFFLKTGLLSLLAWLIARNRLQARRNETETSILRDYTLGSSMPQGAAEPTDNQLLTFIDKVDAETETVTSLKGNEAQLKTLRSRIGTDKERKETRKRLTGWAKLGIALDAVARVLHDAQPDEESISHTDSAGTTVKRTFKRKPAPQPMRFHAGDYESYIAYPDREKRDRLEKEVEKEKKKVGKPVSAPMTSLTLNQNTTRGKAQAALRRLVGAYGMQLTTSAAVPPPTFDQDPQPVSASAPTGQGKNYEGHLTEAQRVAAQVEAGADETDWTKYDDNDPVKV